ncbi:hypothetical protein ACWKS6_21685 [Bacillus cereus]
MTIKFDPESLENQVAELLDLFEVNNIQHDFDDIEQLTDDDDEVIITRDSEIGIWLPHEEFAENIFSIGHLLEMVSEAKSVKVLDEDTFIGEKLAVVAVESFNKDLLFRVAYGRGTEVTEKIGEQEYTLEMVGGVTSFNLALTFANEYNDEHPPSHYDDIFIEIRSNTELNEEIVDSLVQSYIFEVKSTLGLELHRSQRYYYEEEDLMEEEATPEKLRPLLRGKGVEELLRLYNSSLSIQDVEILLLTYTKVIEYVSQTVIRQDLVQETLKKLASPRALVPDANYILELNKVFEDFKNNQKDFQAIKLTIKTCCDIHEIVTIAPEFLKLTKKITIDSKPEDIQKALSEISDAISNTRNMFAHAKTNYEKKGKECPEDQLFDFAKCVDILAQQIIRWFARQHEDNRII